MYKKIFSILTTTVLFAFCAVPGALTAIISILFLIMKNLFDNTIVTTSNLLLLAIAILGCIMTLIGIKKLNQWLYIFVFLSIPISFFLADLIAPLFVAALGTFVVFYPVTFLVIFSLPYVTNKFIRKYYRRAEVLK